MTDEEKKAIKILKENYIEYDDTTLFLPKDRKAIEVVVNLVDKQQKEIEKLKSKKYILNAKTNEIKEIPISDDYISKDKIREKIEELKNRKIGASTGIFAVQVDILEELLGE